MSRADQRIGRLEIAVAEPGKRSISWSPAMLIRCLPWLALRQCAP